MIGQGLIQKIVWILNGCVLGFAVLIPGLSVGTLAIVIGLYEKIIHSLSQFYRPSNWSFLLCIICGCGGGSVVLSRGMFYLIQFHSVSVYSFFTGLIFASLPYLFKKISQEKKFIILIVISTFGFLLASFYISQFFSSPFSSPGGLDGGLGSGLSNSGLSGGLPSFGLGVYFLSGLLACFFAIFPALSGSLVLLFLGTYVGMLHVLSDWMWLELVTFLVGGLIGLLGGCYFIRFLFSRYRSSTYSIIIGFVVGSMVRVFPWHESVNSGIFSIFKALAWVVIGMFVLYFIDFIHRWRLIGFKLRGK